MARRVRNYQNLGKGTDGHFAGGVSVQRADGEAIVADHWIASTVIFI